MTNYNFMIDHSNPQDQKLIYEFAKELNFDIRQKGRKSDGDTSLMKLLKTPANMASVISTKVLQKILMNFVIGYYYKKNKVVIFVTQLIKKLLLRLINCQNTNVYLQNNTKFC